jgi:ribulose kinase
MEGVAFALRMGLEYAENCGLVFDDIRLIGQGGRSALWSQIIADVLKRKIIIPACQDAAYEQLYQVYQEADRNLQRVSQRLVEVDHLLRSSSADGE